MLLSGCCQVNDAPEFWACVRSSSDLGSFALYFSFITRAHILRAALNFAISSKKSIPQFQKNDSRAPKSSTLQPAPIPRATHANRAANVQASSWTALHPASRLSYPLMLV